MEIPKNAVKEKTLFRIMILDSGQIPHATERLYQPLSELLNNNCRMTSMTNEKLELIQKIRFILVL